MNAIKFQGFSNLSGVYKITNIVNGKFYIGSTGRFKSRWSRHVSSLRANKHKNKHLQSSWNKYGQNSFVFEIVEIVHGNKLERTQKEQEHLNRISEDDWKKCYNQKRKVVFSDGPWSAIPSQTTKKKSANQKRLWQIAGYRQTMIAKKLGKRNSNIKKRKFLLYTEGGSFCREFNYQFEAVHELNLTRQGLYSVLVGKKHTHKGYRGKYLE